MGFGENYLKLRAERQNANAAPQMIAPAQRTVMLPTADEWLAAREAAGAVSAGAATPTGNGYVSQADLTRSANADSLRARLAELNTEAQAKRNASQSRALGAESRARLAAEAEDYQRQAEALERQLEAMGERDANAGDILRGIAGGAMSGAQGTVNAAGYLGQSGASGEMAGTAADLAFWGNVLGNRRMKENAEQARQEAYAQAEKPLRTAATFADRFNAETTDGLSDRGKKAVGIAQQAGRIGFDLIPGARELDQYGEATQRALESGKSDADAMGAGAFAMGGALAGSALSSAVGRAGVKLLTNLNKANLKGAVNTGSDLVGLQNRILPNVLLGGTSGTAYAAGDVGMNELYKALTDEDYTPDWNQIGAQAATSFAFGVISSAIRTAATTTANKARMREINDALQKDYAAWDAATTPEQKAEFAARTMSNANVLREELTGLQAVGADREMRDIADFLWSVEQEMMRYAPPDGGGGTLVPTGAAGAGAPQTPGGTPAPSILGQSGFLLPTGAEGTRDMPKIPSAPAVNHAQAGRDARTGMDIPAAPRAGTVEISRAEGQTNAAPEEHTAVNDNPARHTPEEQRVIEAYKDGADQNMVRFIERVRGLQNQDYKNGVRQTIATQTDNAARKAAELTGVDTSGYTNIINGSSVQHIDKRHGASGTADHSMADIEDFARIGFVLDNFTDAQVIPITELDAETAKLTSAWRNSDGTRAPLVQFSMPVNGVYYVVEAVPSSKAKAMAVVSAYMSSDNKKASTLNQVLNMPESPGTPTRSSTSETMLELLGADSSTLNQVLNLPENPTSSLTPEAPVELLGADNSRVAQGGEDVNPAPIDLMTYEQTERGRSARTSPPSGEAYGQNNVIGGTENERKEFASSLPAAAGRDAGQGYAAGGGSGATGHAVRGGDEGRVSGQRAGEEAGVLAEGGPRRPAEQSRTALERQARGRTLRQEKVSSRSLGISDGTDARSLTVLPEEAWDDELRAVADRWRRDIGTEITFVLGPIQYRDADGGTSNAKGAYLNDGSAVIRADHMGFGAGQIAAHETFHAMQRADRGLRSAVEDAIAERYSREEFDAIVETYIKRLRGYIDVPEDAPEIDIDEALARVKEEVLADAYAGMNAFGAHAERYQDTARETVAERYGMPIARETAAATDRTTGPPVAERYSVNQSFADDIGSWDADGRPEGETFILGETGPVLQGLGAIESDIYMNGDKISRILNDHPEMTLDEIKRIPEMLEDPVLILKSKGTNRQGQNTRLAIFGTVKAQNGQPVMAVLDLRPIENRLVVADMQKVNSAYTRNNPVNFVRSSEVLHADAKRTAQLLRTMGLQTRPIELQQSGSMGSISYNRQNVNIKGVPFSDVVRERGIFDDIPRAELPTAEERASGTPAGKMAGAPAGESWARERFSAAEDESDAEVSDEFLQYQTERPAMMETHADQIWYVAEVVNHILTRSNEAPQNKADIIMETAERLGISEQEANKLFLEARNNGLILYDYTKEHRGYFPSEKALEEFANRGVDTLELSDSDADPVSAAVFMPELNGMPEGANSKRLSAANPANRDFLSAKAKSRYDGWERLAEYESDQAYIEAARKRAEDARAERLRNKTKEEFTGTPALEVLGVKIEGSVGSYGDLEQLKQYDKAAKSLKRATKRAEKRLAVTEKEMSFANGVAAGVYGEADIPRTMDADKVMELADYYAAEGAVSTDKIRQRRAEINRTLDEQADEMFKDSEKGRPMGALRLNYNTPERVMRHVFGDTQGERINEWLIYPAQANESESVRFLNRTKAEVAKFEDGKGRVRRLTKEERALTQMVIEGRAAAEMTASAQMRAAIEKSAERLNELKASSGEWNENPRGKKARAKQAETEETLLRKAMGEYVMNANERELTKQYARWLETRKALEKADAEIVNRAADKYAKMYGKFYDAINDFLVAHGYEPIGFIKGYAPHMQPEESLNLLNRAFKALGIGADAMELPASIAGETANYRPNMRWNPYFQHRSGDTTKYDVYEGFDNYIEFASDVLYHTDDIMKLRRAADWFRQTYAPEENRNKISQAKELRFATQEQKEMFLRSEGLIDRASVLSGADVDARLDEYVTQQFENVKESTRFSEFVKWLENYANILAGKQSTADRGAEAHAGREWLNRANRLDRMFGFSKVAGNLSSVLNQSSQLPQIQAELGVWFEAAVGDMLTGRPWRSGWAKESDFLTEKRGADYLAGKTSEKILSAMFAPAGIADELVTTIAVRGKYLQEKHNKKSHAEAMKAADRFGKEIMGSRAKGSMPVAFHAKNPLIRMANKFQVETLNSWEHIAQDLPRDIRETARTRGKAAAALRVAGLLVKGLISAFLLNRLAEELYGGSPAPFDVIGLAGGFSAAGQGQTNSEYWRQIIDDATEEIFGERLYGTEDTDISIFPWQDGDFNSGAAFRELGHNVSNDVPFVRNVSGIMGWGDQSIPFPDLYGTGKELVESIGERGLTSPETGKAALGLAAEVLPGGAQVKKSALGAEYLRRGGDFSGYGDNEKLKYPADTDFWSAAQALAFGKYATDASGEYYAAKETGEVSPLSAEQTALWRSLTGGGADSREVYDAIQAWRGIANDSTLESYERGVQERSLIRGLDLTDDQKLEAYRELANADGRAEKLRTLMDTGLSFDRVMDVYDEYAEIDADEDAKASEKATRFAHWLDGQRFTTKQETEIREQLKYWQIIPAEASRYDKLTGAGLDTEDAYRLTNTLNALMPETGTDSVSDLQKYRAIAGQRGLTDREKLAAIGSIMGIDMETESGNPTQYAKLLELTEDGVTLDDYLDLKEAGAVDGYLKYTRLDYDYGIGPETYIRYKEALPGYDADGNGSYTQAEVKAALDSFGGSEWSINLPTADGISLTNDQKAVLWQMANKSWKARNNPYSVRVGQAVFDAMNGG